MHSLRARSVTSLFGNLNIPRPYLSKPFLPEPVLPSVPFDMPSSALDGDAAALQGDARHSSSVPC